ncbi:DUF4333 domain-containing protein [Spirulina major CS-329]|uniref:DUF4333 domain-containing protein n=1 Tax=Spirulina TaxID=1154 RepID=UPI00232DAD88|nr:MULTISPECIES: DUF4333 domain-containing protein [Spirulina]MDB9495359.1 DUF4333 domain-containing protein [Spirulina subsalsa CS-330]MDB9501738.1 DUF4333 domain-containing protein [Spirulina major CS-329]
MKFAQLQWVVIGVLGLGLALTACGPAETTPDEPTTSEETEAVAPEDTEDAEDTEDTEDAALEPAPEGTFAFTIQDVLLSNFPEQTGYEVESVACPETVDAASDDPFACEVTTTEGFTTLVDVVPNAAEETVDWFTRGLNLADVEEAIETQMTEADVAGAADCGLGDDPNPYREFEAGSSFDCTFKSEDGAEAIVTVMVNNDKGNVTLTMN